MFNCCLALAVLLAGTGLSHAQYFGVLGGLQRSIWRTPGRTLATCDRVEIGGSSTFQAFTNLAVRSELALGIGLNGPLGLRADRVRVTTMARFYPRPKLYLMLGADANIALRQHGGELFAGQPSEHVDLVLFTGAGVRVRGRSEIGLRIGTGLLATVEVPTFGTARDHPASLLYTHLIGGRNAGFTKRRLWRKKSNGALI